MRLPVDPGELSRALARPLSPRPSDLRFQASDLEVVDDRDLGLRMTLTVTTATAPPETWELTIPLGREDLDPDVVPASFVLIVRANVEEWWDMKDREARIAAWGRRVA